MPRSLVTGVTGQDGGYLAELLLAEGHQVFGLVTDGDAAPLPAGVTGVVGDLRDAESLGRALITAEPDEIYNLAAISSVALSWQDPARVADVAALGVTRLLSAVREFDDGRGRGTRVVHAGSAEVFGDAPAPQDEHTPMAPTNPYGAAKTFAQHAVAIYRAAGLFASSAILFNHESPRRPDTFVTRKITRAVAAIAAGSAEPLVLGNLDVRRDWGFAGDYVRAMTLIARHREPADFVVATGVSHTIRDFVRAAFRHAGIEDWEPHVRQSEQFYRPTDAADLRGDPSRAREVLGWTPSVDFDGLVAMMVDADRELAGSGSPT